MIINNRISINYGGGSTIKFIFGNTGSSKNTNVGNRKGVSVDISKDRSVGKQKITSEV